MAQTMQSVPMQPQASRQPVQQQNMQGMNNMPAQTMPNPTGGMPGQISPGMPEEKKSKWWLWVLIAAVIVLVGVAGYFLFLK